MPTSIGIEIGLRYTKIVEVEVKNKPVLRACGIFRTPYLVPESQRQIDASAFWAEAAGIVPLERVRKAQIAVDIPSQNVSLMTVTLPRMSLSELRAAAIVEARRKMIPVSGPDHLFETEVMAIPAGKQQKAEVLVVRAEKAHVQRLLELFKAAGQQVHPELITPLACVLSLSLPRELEKKEEDTAFVEIGTNSINFSVLREGRLVLNRNISYGLGDIARNFCEQLGLPEEKVLEIIRVKGVPQTDFNLSDKVALAEEIMKQKYEASLSGGEEEVNPLELRAIWQTHIERLIQEFRRSFSYYKDLSQGRRIGFVYFLGGGSAIKNFIPAISEMIGGSCSVVSPFAGLEADGQAFPPEIRDNPIYAGAANLAICGASPNAGRPVNFLPLELKKKKVIALRRLAALVSGTALTAVIALWTVQVFHSNRQLSSSLEMNRKALERSETIIGKLRNLSGIEERVEAFSLRITQLRGDRRSFAAHLREFSRLLPEGVLATGLTVHKAAAPVPAGNRGPGGERYCIQADLEIDADYETMIDLVERLKSALESSRFFDGEPEMPPLRFEQVRVNSRADGRLTDPQVRKLSVRVFIK